MTRRALKTNKLMGTLHTLERLTRGLHGNCKCYFKSKKTIFLLFWQTPKATKAARGRPRAAHPCLRAERNTKRFRSVCFLSSRPSSSGRPQRPQTERPRRSRRIDSACRRVGRFQSLDHGERPIAPFVALCDVRSFLLLV